MPPIHRRTLLRGIGAAIGLPWLEAMAVAKPRTTTPGAGPVRMAALFMPNGVHPDMWTPKNEGREFDLPPTLQPLAPYKDELLTLTNLWNQASKGGDGHYVKVSGWLTSTTITKTLGYDISSNGVSMDQLAAQRAGHLTPLPSLELCAHPIRTGVDRNVGYTRVYGSHIAWKSATEPLARELNPRLAFERLFRATQPAGDAVKRDLLLLDRVLDDAKRLKKELGQDDQRRMEEYLSVVRSLEQRLDRASKPQKNKWKARAAIDPAAKPAGIPDSFPEHVRLMLDILALAFQTDTTRIATFMMGASVSNENMSFIDGVEGAHHSISHHQQDADKMRQYQLINRWHVEQYAYLLGKLRAIEEGESNVLSNSMILFGSGFRDGQKHDPHNLPIVVAGGAGGRFHTGQHRVYQEDSPLSNLYVAMLDAFGTPVERFADSAGALRGVLRT